MLVASNVHTALGRNNHAISAEHNLNEFLTRVSEGTIPLSDSRIGQLIFDIAHLPAEGSDESELEETSHEPKGDLKAAAGLLMMIREEGFSKISSKDFMPEIAAIFRGWERSHEVQNILRAEETLFSKLRDRLEKEYQQQTQEIQSEIERLRKQVKAVSEEIDTSKTAFDKEIKVRRESLNAYEEVLKTKLGTESAVKLWERAACSNRQRRNFALTYFLGLGFTGVILFFLNLSWITEQLGGDAGIANITLVTLPALALAWACDLPHACLFSQAMLCMMRR